MENIHLLRRLGRADLLFYLFGFSCFAYVELTTDWLVWSNPNLWRSTVQWYFHCKVKWDFKMLIFYIATVFAIAQLQSYLSNLDIDIEIKIRYVRSVESWNLNLDGSVIVGFRQLLFRHLKDVLQGQCDHICWNFTTWEY